MQENLNATDSQKAQNNNFGDKAKLLTPLSIKLEYMNTGCPVRTEDKKVLSIELVRSNYSSPKTPKKRKHLERNTCIPPISKELKNLNFSEEVKKSCITENPDKQSSNVEDSIKLSLRRYSPPITPRSNAFRKVRCITPCCIKLDRLDNKLGEIPFEMGSQEKSLSSATPKRSQLSTEMNLSTPMAQFSQELKIVLNDRNILTSKTRKHVFDALDEIKIKDEEESRRYKRERALLEIVNSEIKYVHQLELIINFFLKPTQEKKLLRDGDFHTIFGNISPIYNINKELLQELENSCTNVAKAFWRIAPFLKLYSVYACDFKNILKILQSARSLNPQFAKLIENQESRPEVQSKLSALLITPIQRVPRYKLLLTQLLQLTKPTEDDYEPLSECLERIEEAAEHINKIVEDQENMQRLLEIQRFLRSGEPTVVKPGRMVIKEGILIKIATKDSPKEKVYTVLMNDILMFCKMKKGELKVNSLKCSSIFPLGKCRVFEILDKGCMKILCQQEELVLYNEELSETKSWIEKIREYVESHVSGRKTLRKDSSSRRPVKRKDLYEYHEVGISPGRPLKKRKVESEKVQTENAFKISSRRPISRTLVHFEDTKKDSRESSSAESRNSSLPRGSTEEETDNERQPQLSKELYVFGKPHPNDSGFKVGKIFGGFTSSFKKLFGLKS